MTEQASQPDSLPRQLGVGALWLLIINGMIGAGIFGIPAEAARLVGDFSPLLFLATALLMAPVLLCFAELASATRQTGGPARYVGIAFGPMAGFQAGWALYIARWPGSSQRTFRRSAVRSTSNWSIGPGANCIRASAARSRPRNRLPCANWG